MNDTFTIQELESGGSSQGLSPEKESGTSTQPQASSYSIISPEPEAEKPYVSSLRLFFQCLTDSKTLAKANFEISQDRSLPRCLSTQRPECSSRHVPSQYPTDIEAFAALQFPRRKNADFEIF